ncbi:hypothetical protein NBRC3293_0266 [Gluconobacter oxydans NBRC 3293]|uniref:Uncharacterized protein n=1 Tax=Gluconobacter oxydans NBRC 3293 TaxID=1315969 RepID=A0A829X241_GLUOY|nr:hypothetical protein NBRC3293_0266 [Gluconobacter oxydans NBRC 3293]
MVLNGFKRRAIKEIMKQAVAQVVMTGQVVCASVELTKRLAVLHDMAVVGLVGDFPFECHAAAAFSRCRALTIEDFDTRAICAAFR